MDNKIQPLVVLVKITYKKTNISQPPMGILFVGNSLRKAGYAVKVCHWIHTEATEKVAEIIKLRPMMVGFSVITGDPADVVQDVCRRLKAELPHVPIVFGGVHPTLEPQQCLNEDYVDYVVLHEGENTTVMLADAIRDYSDVSNISALGYKENGSIYVNSSMNLEKNLDSFEMDWSLVDIEKYVNPNYDGLKRVLMGYVVSRGCPHKCAFCYNAFFNARKWRHPSAEKVIGDINKLVTEHDLHGVIFHDDNFTVNRKWMFQILDGINIIGTHIETRIDYLNEEYVRQLVARKVRRIFFGVESGSDRLLKLINKGFIVEDIYRGLRLIAKYQVPVKLSFIIGIPTETLAEYRQTLELIIWCVEHLPDVQFTLGFYLPYPGTPLFDICVQRGFKKPKKFSDWVVLDRWGKQEMKLPWIEGNYLDSFETARVRGVAGKLTTLRKGTSLRDRLYYRIYRFRFLNSGTVTVSGFVKAREMLSLIRWYLRCLFNPKAYRKLLSSVKGIFL